MALYAQLDDDRGVNVIALLRAAGNLYRRVAPLPDAPPERRHLMVRVEQRVWLLVAAIVAVTLVGQIVIDIVTPNGVVGTLWYVAMTLVPRVVGTFVIMRFAFAQSAAAARQQEALRREQERAIRLDAALLVARTAAHRVNNALTPVVGFSELLTLAPTIRQDATLRAYAAQLCDGAQAAAREIQQLQRLIRLETDVNSPRGLPVLDVERSIVAESTMDRPPVVPDAPAPPEAAGPRNDDPHATPTGARQQPVMGY
jgi:signal transduction histidine kinase